MSINGLFYRYDGWRIAWGLVATRDVWIAQDLLESMYAPVIQIESLADMTSQRNEGAVRFPRVRTRACSSRQLERKGPSPM